MSGVSRSPSRRTSAHAGSGATPTLHQLLEAVVVALEDHGVTTSSPDGQIVGGVALAQPFYAASLYFEGRAPEGPAVAPFHVALAARAPAAAPDGGGAALALVHATREQLAAAAPPLPRTAAPVIAQLLSPEAISGYRWARPPAVLLFGACPAGAGDDAALDACEAAGIPVSPSMTGPHPEELVTQLQVFFKQFRYPEHAAFVLADHGFMVFGDSIEDAAAAYDATIRPLLLGAAERAGPAPLKAPAGGLAGALRVLSGLLQRAPSDAAASAVSVGPSSASGAASPMLGVLQATRAKFARSLSAGSSGCGAAAGAAAAAAAPARPQRVPGGGASVPEEGEDGGVTALPDEIRAAPAVVAHGVDQHTVPRIQTGLRPW